MSGNVRTCDHGALREAVPTRAGASIQAYDVVRIVLGLLLLLAALLKGYQLATEPVIGGGILSSRWFLIALVEFELIFGLWLLAGIRPQGTRRIAIGWFTLLAFVSFYKGVGGEQTCSCLGRLVDISPWYALLFDIAAIVVLLTVCKPIDGQQQGATFSIPEFAVCATLFVAPSMLLMGHVPAATLTWDGSFADRGGFLVLEPEKWTGRPFPLLRHIDARTDLSVGDWTVVLYRHDCPKCHALIDDYIAETQTTISHRNGLVFVEVPPFGKMDPRLKRGNFLVGRLLDTNKWFVRTPVVLNLSDGRVVSYVDSAADRGDRI